MKRCIRSALLLPLALLIQCGERDLTLSIDLLSYVEPEFRSTVYGPVLPGMPTTVIGLIQAQINLLQGVDDATQVKSTALRVGADFVNESGSATGSLAVFVAPVDLFEPLSFTPVADIHLTLQPGHTTTVAELIPSTPELMEVLTSDMAWFAVRITCNTEGSTNVLWGTVTLTELTAILVTEADL
ncbi:hypothetical protein ACFLQW_02435 [Candidatus Zixiibacteriota bacterium]